MEPIDHVKNLTSIAPGLMPGDRRDVLAAAAELTRLKGQREALQKALTEIAEWRRHSGTAEYEKGSREPCGYYNHAYYTMEKEIFAVRDDATAALALCREPVDGVSPNAGAAEVCPACRGSGTINFIACQLCEGRGRVLMPLTGSDDMGHDERIDKPKIIMDAGGFGGGKRCEWVMDIGTGRQFRCEFASGHGGPHSFDIVRVAIPLPDLGSHDDIAELPERFDTSAD